LDGAGDERERRDLQQRGSRHGGGCCLGCRADWPRGYSTQMRFRVVADDGFAPPIASNTSFSKSYFNYC
jgi:hypothetical protein